jgi:cytochrome P450
MMRIDTATFHRTLDALRAESPIQQIDLREVFGLPPLTSFDVPGLHVALSYDAARTTLQEARTFSSTIIEQTFGRSFGRSMLVMDGAEHNFNRGLVAAAFRQRSLETDVFGMVAEVADSLVDDFVARGGGDIVDALTLPLPMIVICRMLGLPESDQHQFVAWTNDLINVDIDPAAADAASADLSGYFQQVIDSKRTTPGNDLTSRLLAAEVDGVRLRDDEVISFLKILLPGGAETTFRALGSLFTALLTMPEQFELLRNDRTLVPRAVEEGLRWETPAALTSARLALEDAEVCGVTIPAGHVVEISYTAANHDPLRWEDPHAFRLQRPARAHLAHLTFASGPHVCLGAPLARFEMSAVLNAVLEKMPQIRLDPACEPPVIFGLRHRSPERIDAIAG